MLTRRAVYYPHTAIADARLLKSALLLWDSLEYIVPYREWERESLGDRELDAAAEVIAHARQPTEDEKQRAHNRVEALVTQRARRWRPLARPLASRSPDRNEVHLVYARKFLDGTWDLLEEAGLAGAGPDRTLRQTDRGVALTLMTVLADCCAGKEKATVTDRADCFGALAEFIGAEVGQPSETDDELTSARTRNERSETSMQLATISLEVIDPTSLRLGDLIAMRQREANGDAEVTAMRRNYTAAIARVTERIAVASTQTDVDEITDQFRADMRQSMAELKAALRRTNLQLLLSREFLIGAALSFVSPTSALALAALGVGATAAQWRDRHAAALGRFEMAWLHQARARAPLPWPTITLGRE